MRPLATEFRGRVTDGRLPASEEKKLADALRCMEGKAVKLALSEVKKRRSNNQNSYYFGVVVAAVTQMFRDAGNMVDAEEVHEFLKLRVGKLAQVFVTPDGEVIKGLGSTKKLSTTEFEVYLEQVRAWAAEMGCHVPLPHEEIETNH